MLKFKVLVLELRTVDALASTAVANGKVTALHHEPFDYTVEQRSFVKQLFAAFSDPLFPRAQGTEIFSRRGNVSEKTENHSLRTRPLNLDVKIHFV